MICLHCAKHRLATHLAVVARRSPSEVACTLQGLVKRPVTLRNNYSLFTTIMNQKRIVSVVQSNRCGLFIIFSISFESFQSLYIGNTYVNIHALLEPSIDLSDGNIVAAHLVQVVSKQGDGIRNIQVGAGRTSIVRKAGERDQPSAFSNSPAARRSESTTNPATIV